MADSISEDMKRYVGFDADDEANLRRLAGPARAVVSAVAARFTQELRRHDGTRDVLGSDVARWEGVRTFMESWLKGLFAGDYERDYWEARADIGRTHHRVGLPLRYIITAMQVIWQEFERLLRPQPVPDMDACLVSLHKLLSLEIGMMLETYQESHTEQVRRAEREAFQARLRETEQLAQTGEWAASLAHEIKNPLAGISGAIQVIRDGYGADDPRRPVLGDVLRQISRLDRSVTDLLVFARPKPPRYQPCQPADLAARAVELLRKEPDYRGIAFEISADPGLPALLADEYQLEQVLLNLLHNAAQASSDGDCVRLLVRAAGDGVSLAVVDRGCGMSPEVARRATEPFFTTRLRGTGLGLAICRKVIEAHGGTLAIETRLRQGTTVTVTLCCQPPQSPAGDVP